MSSQKVLTDNKENYQNKENQNAKMLRTLSYMIKHYSINEENSEEKERHTVSFTDDSVSSQSLLKDLEKSKIIEKNSSYFFWSQIKT